LGVGGAQEEQIIPKGPCGAHPPKCPCLSENLKSEKNGLASVPSCIKGLKPGPKKGKKEKKKKKEKWR
jgi:hypothetical protein